MFAALKRLLAARFGFLANNKKCFADSNRSFEHL